MFAYKNVDGIFANEKPHTHAHTPTCVGHDSPLNEIHALKISRIKSDACTPQQTGREREAEKKIGYNKVANRMYRYTKFKATQQIEGGRKAMRCILPARNKAK